MKRIALALVALLALSGCAEIGSLSDKAQIDLAMQNLSSELDALAGISLDYTAELTPDYTYTVVVHATGPELTTDQLVDAAMLASDELAAAVFGHGSTWFDLTSGGVAVLSTNVFDLERANYADDFALAEAVSEAYLAKPSLSYSRTEDGGVTRTISVSAPQTTPDWNALRALHDTGAAQPYWQLAGLSFDGDIPPEQVTDLVDGISAVVPMGTESLPWAMVDWYNDSIVVSLLDDDVNVVDPTASTLWPRAVQVASLIGASALPARSFMFYGSNGRGTAIVFFGTCADSQTYNDGDPVLADALAAAGVADVHPGQCITA